MVMALFSLLPMKLKGATLPTNPVDFGGGVDYKNICSQIADNRACESLNMVNDRHGSAIPRRGFERFISQAISSQPITSLYKAYISTGTGTAKLVFAATGNKILVSTSDTNPFWVVITSNLAGHNQHFSWVTMNNKVIFTGDRLTDPIFQYDYITSSFTNLIPPDQSTSTQLMRAKYLHTSRNYLLIANVAYVDQSKTVLTPGVTYYHSRLHYSLLAQPSSMTVSRYFDYRADDGEEINWVWENNGRIEIGKQSSIHDLSFTILNLLSEGGDWVNTPIVQGFGLVASRGLASTGLYDIIPSKKGFILWDGSRRTRFNVTDEEKPISTLIEPLIDRLIKAGTYEKSHGIFYSKNQWYVWSYEDPEKFPKGRPNSVMIYDLLTGEWFPIGGMLAESFLVAEGSGDQGDFFYGDSMDGYVYKGFEDARFNDARKEIVLDTMDSTKSWTRGTTNYIDVIEGTGSVRISLSSTIQLSSITRMGVFNVGEWHDKTRVLRSDKISFKVYVTSIQNIGSIRLDLQVEDVENDFNNNFSSITISSGSLTAGNTAWSTIEVKLSSFTILENWISLSSEAVPFANSLTFWGIRFVSTGVGDATLSFDDLRIVQGTESPIKTERLTKQFDLGNPAEKDYRQVILTRSKPSNSSFSIDVIGDFGEVSNTLNVKAEVGNELFVCGFSSSNGITKINSVDFSEDVSTKSIRIESLDIKNAVSDGKNLYAGNSITHQLYKIDITSLTLFISTYGALGTGATNFDTIHQIDIDKKDDGFVYIVDNGNNRVKVHRKKNLDFVRSYGELGTGATNVHNPTGITIDDKHAWVGDDGNNKIKKFTISTFGYVSEIPLDTNTIGETTLDNDETYLYDAYNKVSDVALYYQDVVLERRLKSNGSLVNRIIVRPKDSVAVSTSGLRGDIALLGNYIFISFTDDVTQNGTYYIQKRLKDDFSLVSEYKSKHQHFSVVGDGLGHLPSIKSDKIYLKVEQGRYIQLRYYSEGLDNDFKLFNQSFAYVQRDYEED